MAIVTALTRFELFTIPTLLSTTQNFSRTTAHKATGSRLQFQFHSSRKCTVISHEKYKSKCSCLPQQGNLAGLRRTPFLIDNNRTDSSSRNRKYCTSLLRQKAQEARWRVFLQQAQSKTVSPSILHSFYASLSLKRSTLICTAGKPVIAKASRNAEYWESQRSRISSQSMKETGKRTLQSLVVCATDKLHHSLPACLTKLQQLFFFYLHDPKTPTTTLLHRGKSSHVVPGAKVYIFFFSRCLNVPQAKKPVSAQETVAQAYKFIVHCTLHYTDTFWRTTVA